MKDLHHVFTAFKHDFPQVYEKHEALGKLIYEESGPLTEKVRWLIKVAVWGHRPPHRPRNASCQST